MFIIEPCCTSRHLVRLRDAIDGNGGTRQFEGYDDMSLAELLPALLTRYCETRLLIAAPSIPDQAADAIGRCMRRKLARMDGKGKLDQISHLTIIADLSMEMSPTVWEWLHDNPFGERLELIDNKNQETIILLPDLAITGPVNLRYGRHFVATITANKEQIEKLWNEFMPKMQEDSEEVEIEIDPESESEFRPNPPKRKRKKNNKKK